ncbi:Laccase-4 [Holothuria leucospilota]|uniref:Laccase-4 n=1 Tax=Holothuria leucospilota TaxID=206669 RepID=A0A9Q1CFA7_HOLLE|nr:Laccase-4 [Holothuria leucospilota]
MQETKFQPEAVDTDEPTSSNRQIVCSSKRKVAVAAVISFVLVAVIILTVTLSFGGSNEEATEPTKSPLTNTTIADQAPNPDSPPVSTSCDRICTHEDIKTCVFTWNVSYYYSLTRPCGNCPFDIADCYQNECIPLNGLKRPLVTVNRQVPGPKIVVCKNDIIQVTVNNYLDDMTGITFHWHGIDQLGTPAMDGPSMITQCPIPFGLSFVYKFKADHSGTYFWHSHIGSNRADGLAGPIVVREVSDPHEDYYDFDLTNHTLMIQDWMNITQNANYVKYLYSGGKNQPDFILINGRGKGPAFQNSSEIAYTPREVITVEKGKRYRIRLMSNAFTGCPMKVSVDNHSLAAISMDGFPINLVPFDSLITNAGERFDFILNANQTVDNYWLRVEGIGDNCKRTDRRPGLQELAILRYIGAPDTDPKAFENSTIDAGVVFNPSARQIYDKSIRIVNLTSLISFKANERVSTYYLSVGVSKLKTDDHALRDGLPQINRISFDYPPVPLLTQHNEVNQSLFCDAREATKWSHCEEQRCSCAQIITAELGETIELFFYNGIVDSTACHPLHLHGISYRVVGSGLMDKEYTPEEVEEMDKEGRFFRLSTQFPPVKDTVCVSHGSYMIIQFVANNPGWWFLHCHLDFHALLGMAMVVRIGTDEDIKGLIPPDFPRCQNFN